MKVTPDIVARAIVAAARVYGFDPVIAMIPGPRDGRGRVKLAAAAALVGCGLATPKSAAALLGLPSATWLSPSQLATRKVYSEALEAVMKAVDGGPLPKAAPLKPVKTTPTAHRDIDPRRDMDREQRIIAGRLAGKGPAALARDESLSLTGVNVVIARAEASGTVFPVLRAGRPSGTKNPPGGGRTPRPRTARPPAKAKADPPPPPVPMEAIEAFPADHAAWKPLEGSTPVLLIHHDKGCRWPVEVTGATGPMVCNQRTHGKTPYCEPHAWLGASPTIRASMVRPVIAPAAPRVARPFASRDLQDA